MSMRAQDFWQNGYNAGFEKGFNDGFINAKKESEKEIIKCLLLKNYTQKQIVDVSGLSKEVVESIIKEIKK